MSDDRSGANYIRLTIALLAIIFTLIAADMASDYGAGLSPGHLLAELSVMLLCVAGAGLLWRELRDAQAQVVQLRRDVEVVHREALEWRSQARDVVRGLATAMEGQFDRWHLTAAEREIALELLRGMSHRAIAQRRHTSERTVREQARAVYQKASLPGRSALAGFFLDDLLDGRPSDPGPTR